MKIGIFQDVHANLPAFDRAIAFFREQSCELMYHIGDLIGIGPYPRETVEKAISVAELKFIMGNHDYWYAYGLPHPYPSYMNEEEILHHLWTHEQIGKDYRGFFQQWKFTEELLLDKDDKVFFQHYGFDKTLQWFKAHIEHPTATELDILFDEINASYIFYGHNHLASDILGRCRYVNLGSAGCHHLPEVRLGILEHKESKVELTKYSITYDDHGLLAEYERKGVPARDFIKKVFITRK